MNIIPKDDIGPDAVQCGTFTVTEPEDTYASNRDPQSASARRSHARDQCVRR
jgi:hypothetical protein